MEDDATIQHEHAVKFDFHTGGYPMTTTSYAAFYPAFFLHHCNVDRLYEAYLRAHPDSQSEFRRYNSREYNTELRPFVNKNTGDIYKHADLFDAAHLGYAYDSLPKQPRSRLREAPDYALFRGLDLGLEVFKDQALPHSRLRRAQRR